ncbi:CST complex subunit TEN1-like [Hibiscus syriacus]|uniref:CST complex subunit TEN1-like n=1 Tax=Hibiscus syriacus TaxID=106335 RepID=UPI0019244EBB|nr:CST complex subunit TEN1-like [Hibiscus syriacus]
MAATESGALVTLLDLQQSSIFFKEGASLRVIGKLQDYSVETAIAVIADQGVTLKIDTQHLTELGFRIGSIFQFIGELLIQPNNEAVLQARTGRNIDGIDLDLY